MNAWHERFLKGAEAALEDPTGGPGSRVFSIARHWRYLVATLAVALMWIGLRVMFWNGYYVEDSPGYVTDAVYAALRDYHARHYLNGLNVGTYLPVAIPLALFGKSEAALSLWPLFCSGVGVASLGGLVGTLFGRRFGFVAAFLYATYPGDVFFSTVVMPDAIQSGFLSLSFYLLVSAYAGPVSRKDRRLAASGLVMGLCHLVRANGILLLPAGVCGLLILSRSYSREPRRTARDGVVYLSAVALVILAEASVYLWAAGDFFLRFRVVGEHYGPPASTIQHGLNIDPMTIPFSIFPPAMWWVQGSWGVINQDQAYHGLIFCWALVATLGAIAALAALRTRRAVVPAHEAAGFALAAVWLWWPVLFHQFGSQSLTHFVPMHRLSRQLVVYAPAAIATTVAGCALVVRAARNTRLDARRPVWAAAATALLAVHLHYNWQGQAVAHDSFQDIKRVYVRIRQHLPADLRTLIADPGDLGVFDFWLNPLGSEKVRMVGLLGYARCEDITDAVILTKSNRGWWDSAPVIQETVARLPCVLDPPAHWRLLYDGHPERVYVVGHPAVAPH